MSTVGLLERPQTEGISAAPALFGSEPLHTGFSASDLDFLRQTGISPFGDLSGYTSPLGQNLRLPTEAPLPVTNLNVDMDVVRGQVATPRIEIANKDELRQSIALAVGAAVIDRQMRSIWESFSLDDDEEDDEKSDTKKTGHGKKKGYALAA